LLAAKRQNRKIAAVSCYDYTTDKLISQTGVQMIKIEASGAYLDVIKAVSDAGMAVMAHIGIRPQSISKIGRFKAEATTAEMSEKG